MTSQLFDPAVVNAVMLREANYCSSHGARGAFLGAGAVYYCLAYGLRAKTCVCLGSGGGYVPRLMRQGQRDAGIGRESETWLVDANLPEAGWGRPSYLGEDSFFRQTWPEIKLVTELTSHAVGMFTTIDYLHIDADHSYEHVAEDWRLYSPLVPARGVITLHDTSRYGVTQLVRELQHDPEWGLADLWWTGTGTAVATRRNAE